MVKKRRILYIILFLLLIVIAKIFSIKSTNKEIELKDIKYEMGDGKTTYRDFDQLKCLDTEYSYSSINYRENTQFVLLNSTNNRNFEYNSNEGTGVIGKNGKEIKGILLRLTSNANPKVLIKNCAVGSEGQLLDVVIELSNYKAYRRDNNDHKEQFVQLRTTDAIIQETAQNGPICADDTNTTQYTIHNKIGSPISFSLTTYMAEVKYTMTYYEHPKNNVYPHVENQNYILDLSQMKRAEEVTKTNGYYYDLDIVKGWENNSQPNSRNVTIFDRYKWYGKCK